MLHEWHYNLKERPKLVIQNGDLVYTHPEPTPPLGAGGLVTWVYEEGSFAPCAKIVGEERYSIINDYIGRPIQCYDESGNIVWETDYDIYGKLRNFSSPPSEGLGEDFIPFRQLGQYEDVETGLYYNRFRFYNPESGMYISQDPIGLKGGNPNFYAYTHDSNWWVDIFGLDCNLLGEWGEKFAKEQLEGSGKYKKVFSVQNNSGHGIDLVGMRTDGKFDFFEVKTTGLGKTASGNRNAVPLSDRQMNSDFFIKDILGKDNIKDFGLTRNEAKNMLNNIGDKRVIDVFVDNGKVNSVLTSIW